MEKGIVIAFCRLSIDMSYLLMLSRYIAIALSSNLLIGIEVSSEYALSLAYNSLSTAFEMAIRFVNPLLSILKSPFMGIITRIILLLQLQVDYSSISIADKCS